MTDTRDRSEYHRKRRQQPEVARLARARARASGRAYHALTRAHPDEYRAIYLEHKEQLADIESKSRRYAIAQSRARIILKSRYVAEYKALYRENLTKEGL